MGTGLFRRITAICICITWILLQTACKEREVLSITPSIIPAPHSQTDGPGLFLLKGDIQYEFDESLKPAADFLKEFLEKGLPGKLTFTAEKSKRLIGFYLDNTIENDEEYRLKVNEDHIKVFSSSLAGSVYAVQSIRQLIPPCIEDNSCAEVEVAIPELSISDSPAYAYRGMHLDVGRHLFPVDFIKKYIDMLSLLKMNIFHWHLTEDQGWRIEIKKYPKLTEHAAYREETLIGHYNDQPQRFDGKPYGGFYSQEEVKDIVAYAGSLGITIIPEIEMPGHSQAAISAYPDLGCSGDSVSVATKWGVFEEVYCPKESTFTFLEDVIDEVVSLFPGEYIHIGGDEAPKIRWKNCDHCQQLIKKENLKDEHELQSYFISRMEKYINSQGKQIIGWDEILEGGLAPNATVMSWRGTTGAVEAAKQHHQVILTPTSHCYFDYYQSEDEGEPLAIGGFLPLEKVYSFNPVPEGLTDEESRYVLGAQGNVWTEYMPTVEKVEYMVFPRIVALSEVLWSQDENKDYIGFVKRLEGFNQRLEHLNVNYANHLYNIKGGLEANPGGLKYNLLTENGNKEIRYTTDGTDPSSESPLYSEPISITGSFRLKARSYERKEALSPVFEQTFELHKAVGKKVELNPSPNKAYSAGGKKALVNSISGSDKRFGDSEWLGFWGEDVEVEIDLVETTEINTVKTRFFNAKGQWIYAPKKVILYFDDNKEPIEYNMGDSEDRLVPLVLDCKGIKTKKIKLVIKQYGIIPQGAQGSGHPAWTFIDEIQLW